MKTIALAAFLLFGLSAFGQHVVLMWTPPKTPTCGPLIGYKVFRATATGMQDFTKPIATIGLVTTYSDATVVYGNTYFYKLKTEAGAECGNGESVASNEAMAVIPAQIIVVQPDPPVQSAPQVVIP